MNEVVSEDGYYPTASVCELVGCPGCLPDAVTEDDGSRKPEYESMVPGLWTGDVVEFGDSLAREMESAEDKK